MGERVPGFLRRAGIAVGAHGPARLRRASARFGAEHRRATHRDERPDGEDSPTLFRGPLEGSDGSAARRVVADRLGDLADAPLPATLYIDAQLALVDDMLHYFDRASMAHSLEVRVPFLDHQVVEYCAGIPAELKVRRLTTKTCSNERHGDPARPNHRQAQDRLLCRVGRRLVPRPGGRRDRRVPTRSSAALRRASSILRSSVTSFGATPKHPTGPTPPAARDPHARGVALDLPPACPSAAERTPMAVAT